MSTFRFGLWTISFGLLGAVIGDYFGQATTPSGLAGAIIGAFLFLIFRPQPSRD